MSGGRKRSGHARRALARLHTSLVGYDNHLLEVPEGDSNKSPEVRPRSDQSGHGRHSRVAGAQKRQSSQLAEGETGSLRNGRIPKTVQREGPNPSVDTVSNRSVEALLDPKAHMLTCTY